MNPQKGQPLDAFNVLVIRHSLLLCSFFVFVFHFARALPIQADLGRLRTTLVSVEDHRANQGAIYLTFRAGSQSSGSQQSVKSIVYTIPLHNASPDFAADVIVRSNNRPEIAKLLYYLEIVAVI